jgi:hypothetical protein
MHIPSNPKNECYTPSYFIDPIRDVFEGFDLDPFSSAIANETVKADFYLDERQDGLIQNWLELSSRNHPTFWVNPPYSRHLIQKCVAKTLTYVGQAEIFLLVNSQTSSKSYQACLKGCRAILFPEKRIQFDNPYNSFAGSNNKDQTLFYFGQRDTRFRARLGRLGEAIIKH